MPTPSEGIDAHALSVGNAAHSSCPPDIERTTEWRTQALNNLNRSPSATNVTASDDTSARPISVPRRSESEKKPETLHDVSSPSQQSNLQAAGANWDSSPISQIYGLESDDRGLSSPATATSSAVDLTISSRLDIQSTRVRLMLALCALGRGQLTPS